jgi:hypothetical protein
LREYAAMNEDREAPPARRRGRGRPSLESGPSVSVTVKFPTATYDALWQRAHRERVSIPQLIRNAIRVPLKTR